MLKIHLLSNASQAPQSHIGPTSEDAIAINCTQQVAEGDDTTSQISSTAPQTTEPPPPSDPFKSTVELKTLTAEQQCLQYFKARLGKLKQQSSHEYLGHCPFHEDDHPSLSVNPVKRTWYCLSACQVGGEMIDFEMKYAAEVEEMQCDKTEAKKRIEKILGCQLFNVTDAPEAIYGYTDQQGNLLYQLVRMPNKQFYQRRPDGNDGWINNLSGVKKVLYNLPDVIASTFVIIVEGEKDADNVKAALHLIGVQGWSVTTSPGGAGKWLDGFATYLSGKVVLILPDNDDAGRKHANQVALSVCKVAKSVKIVELPGLPHKGDVTDFLTQHTSDELFTLAASVPEWKPDIVQHGGTGQPKIIALSDILPLDVEWLWEPYLALGMLAMLSGDPGAGKTFIALAIAASITVGQVPFTKEPRSVASVLYLTVENSPAHVLRPRFDALGGDSSRFHIVDGVVRLSDKTFLSHAIENTKAQLVVIDPIQSFFGADVDAHRANETRPLMDDLARLADEYKCCILLLRHLSKAPAAKAIYQGLGSIDFTGAVRTELLAGCSSSDPTMCAFVHTKSNLAQRGPSIGYSIAPTGKFTWTGESKLTTKDLLSPEVSLGKKEAIIEAKEFLLNTLAVKPQIAGEIIAEAEQAGISKATLKRAKKELNIKSAKSSLAGPWEWVLPKASQVVITQTMIPFDFSGETKSNS